MIDPLGSGHRCYHCGSGCQGGGVNRRWDEGFEVSFRHIPNDGGSGSGERVGLDVGRPNVFSHCAKVSDVKQGYINAIVLALWHEKVNQFSHCSMGVVNTFPCHKT